jgi:hypothetical protein
VDSISIIKYLREHEFVFETALAHESGGPEILVDEKNDGQKSCDTVPLRCFFNIPGIQLVFCYSPGTEQQEEKCKTSTF